LSWQILQSDVTSPLPLKDNSVQCVVTSPPYWGLRDYGVANQLGLEATPELYVERMVAVFREVRRVLRDDGTVWVNLGDSYCAQPAGNKTPNQFMSQVHQSARENSDDPRRATSGRRLVIPNGLKQKDLVGIPWMVAFALQADGWYLRSDIIWSKPNPMPESVTDRPTKAHEYIFLLSKNERYFWDQDAVREDSQDFTNKRTVNSDGSEQIRKAWTDHKERDAKKDLASWGSKYGSLVPANGRNIRTVWEIATQPYPQAHFATFPEAIAERCIKAGSKKDDVILDPFSGAGTTALVADKLGRFGIGCELKFDYCQMAHKRCYDDAPLLRLLG